MTKRMKRAVAAFLALTMLTGTAASASDALGHDIHSGGVGLAPGTGVDFDILCKMPGFPRESGIFRIS